MITEIFPILRWLRAPMEFPRVQSESQIKHHETAQAVDEFATKYSLKSEANADGDGVKLSSPEVNSVVLLDINEHLCKIANKAAGHSGNGLPSALRRRENKKALDNSQISAISAGWRVRQLLSDLPIDSCVDDFYLECVEKGMLQEVEALFTLAKLDKSIKIHKNCEDKDCRSALVIAIANRNLDMMEVLLKCGVEAEYSILHAINNEHLEGARLILSYDRSSNLKITGEHHYFRTGLTPMLLCGQRNNYPIFSLLHEYGHRLNDTVDLCLMDSDDAWEAANERKLLAQARTCPAYITLVTEVCDLNPVSYCLNEIRKIRENEPLEHEYEDLESIVDNLEDYMCSLLDQICSSEELAKFFQYDYEKIPNPGSVWAFLGKSISRRELGTRFKLLEMASDHGLKRFVTHQQSQLAVSYLRYRSMPFLRNHGWYIRLILLFFIGLMYPVLSLIYLFAPLSRLGGIIVLPTVSFYCHLMSELLFASVLFLDVMSKNVDQQYLGAPPTITEWLMVLWILGKWVQEIQECGVRGPAAYFNDYWNYADLMLLLLFSIDIGLRAADLYIYGGSGQKKLERTGWHFAEPRLLAEGVQAVAYIFVFFKLLAQMRINKTLGPLQVSLGRMLSDIFRFICIFILVICAFAFGLCELYWYYGTEEGQKMFLISNKETNETKSCIEDDQALFTTLWKSFSGLFWALFDLLETESLSLCGKHRFTATVGWYLIGFYYAVAIIVMLNMLVAMMNISYVKTSKNEDTEWKFNRAQMWIRFFRGEVIRPPPMNLLPNPWRIAEAIQMISEKLLGKKFMRKSRNTANGQIGNFWEILKSDPITVDDEMKDIESGVDSYGCTAASEQMTDTSLGIRTVSSTVAFTDSYTNKVNGFETGVKIDDQLRRMASVDEEYEEADAETPYNTDQYREVRCKKLLWVLVRRYKLKFLIRK